MATLSSLVDRVRLELGDQGKSFVTQFMADGSTNRFELHYSPIDAATLYVSKDGADISSTASVEESTGILVLDEVPEAGAQLLVGGTYYRYFTAPDYEYFVTAALAQHSNNKTDTFGRTITIANLPSIEEYPVALYASTLALYTLATDASFDINIFAPDGVTIPRSERYRQLMEMIDSRREQYRELCVQLGIGMYQIEVFNLRRISKMTNRYVPVYRPLEVDDRSFPIRVNLPLPTYGDRDEPWPTKAEDLTAFEGIPFTHTKTFEGDFADKVFTARILTQRGSTYKVRDFDLVVVDNEDGTFTATFSLDAENTRRLARRTWWSLSYADNSEDTTPTELYGGQFFTERASEAVL